ncbi:MAG: hypothetical protein OXU26_07200, partial [Acidobacteriota bacterium]|nr:hypothetical protein [Acidobacteriota bacterium]
MGREHRVLNFQGSFYGLGGGRLFLAWIGIVLLYLPVRGAQSPGFETDVLPIFQQHCLQCHSDQARQGGLSLETLESVLAGGDSGA